jgi:hypothetical protein
LFASTKVFLIHIIVKRICTIVSLFSMAFIVDSPGSSRNPLEYVYITISSFKNYTSLVFTMIHLLYMVTAVGTEFTLVY